MCSVPGCTSNYHSNTEGSISTFSFPSEIERRQKWIRAIHRADFVPGKSACVCIKHFSESDIIRIDSVKRPDGSILTLPRKYPKLTSNALPTIFPGQPSYLSQPTPAKRKSPEERREEILQKDEMNFRIWCDKDKIVKFEDLVGKLKDINLLQFSSKIENEYVVLYKLETEDIPSVMVSLKIFKDLSIQVCLNGCKIPSQKYIWVLGDSLLCTSYSILESLLSHLNAFNNSYTPLDANSKLNNLSSAMDDCITELLDSNDDTLSLIKLKFLKEQLELSVCKQPRYSSETFLWASLLFFSFPGAYAYLRNSSVLTLPHPSYLRKLSADMKSEEGLKASQIHYLKEKSKCLKPHERIVNVLFDEIHIMQKVTYRGGRLEGFSEAHDIARRIQAFMLTSIFSENEDIVALYPVKSLNAEELKKLTLQVLKVLHECGYVVLSLICDNNRVNRNSFHLLCDGDIKPYIDNPFNPTEKIFLLFDSVHLFKSVRNNWLNQANDEQSFIFPYIEDPKLILCANLKDLKDLHFSEETSIVKLAPSLSKKVLFPSSIERQNVSLAVRLFDEKNIVALSTFFKDQCIVGSAEFIKIILSWWKIVNVGSPETGHHLRDPLRKPIRSSEDENVKFLKAFVQFLQLWQNLSVKTSPKHTGKLTNDTFFSLKHTTEAYIILVAYVFETFKDCKYLLLRKFQTDPLEARFGRYRQMSGSCYHVSVSQVLESEKRLKIISILKLKSSLYGEFSLHDFSLNLNESSKEIPFNENLLVAIEKSRYVEIDTNTACVLFYIAGYISHSILKYVKGCTKCKEVIALDKELTTQGLQDERNSYLLNLCRGGLKQPTDFIYLIVVEGYTLFQTLISSEFENEFLNGTNHRAIFMNILEIKIEEIGVNFSDKCTCGVDTLAIVRKVCHILGNIFGNNYSKIMNNNTLSANKRKIMSFSTQ